MKRNIFLAVLFLAATFVTTMILFPAPYPAMALEESTWDTNFNIMYLSQEGTSVTGEYIYDNGVLTGTMEGQDLKGWWREYNNAQECGPGGTWSGPLYFRFADDWMTFNGDWGYCDEGIGDLDPSNNTWYGNRRENDYFTEEECVAAGRHWCSGICQIEECGTDITPDECESVGKIWCNGACQIEACITTTTTTSMPPTTSTTTKPPEECEPPDVLCGGDTCCDFSKTCCNGECINEWRAECCDDHWCFSDEYCCGDICCDEDEYCCDGKCCNSYDEACYPFLGCIPCISSKLYGGGSEEVELLRNFRDEVLSQSPVGQEIIRLYYQWNPAIVTAMENNEVFKEKVKGLIDGILPLITKKAE